MVVSTFIEVGLNTLEVIGAGNQRQGGDKSELIACDYVQCNNTFYVVSSHKHLTLCR